jgi:hypothetical protein
VKEYFGGLNLNNSTGTFQLSIFRAAKRGIHLSGAAHRDIDRKISMI